MSYHIGPSPRVLPLAPPVLPHHYPLVPLSQVPPLAPAGMRPETKRALVILGVLILVLIAITIFSQKKPVKRNAPVKRLSTPELAKNLYERLERRGGASDTTMRSLKAYASKR